MKERVRSRFPNGIRGSLRRGRTVQRKNLKPLPLLKLIAPADIVTLMNFICGVLSVMASVNGGDGFRIAMLLILVGIIFDGIDGPIARKFGSSHNFGIWLDSLADAVTFCVAPAILVYNLFKVGDQFSLLNVLVIISALSIALLGILRLARFSLQQNKWKDFIGLPTPAFATVVVSLSSLYFWSLELDLNAKYFTTGDTVIVPGILLILSWVMVSDILFRKYHGKIMVAGGFILLIMIFTLLFGVHDPLVGLMGSIIFSAASLAYLISPLSKGRGNVWGARRRLENEYYDDDLDDIETEDDMNGQY